MEIEETLQECESLVSINAENYPPHVAKSLIQFYKERQLRSLSYEKNEAAITDDFMDSLYDQLIEEKLIAEKPKDGRECVITPRGIFFVDSKEFEENCLIEK